MSPSDAFMDLLFLVPFTFGPGLLYLVISSWWTRRRGRPAPRAVAHPVGGPGAGSAVDLDRDDVTP